MRTDLQLSEPVATVHQEGSTCWVPKSGEKIPSSARNIRSRGPGISAFLGISNSLTSLKLPSTNTPVRDD
jgi:hypothetical protein